MTLAGALLLLVIAYLPVWLPAVAIGFAAGWFARRRKP